MKGTQKQISWAEDIKANVLATIEAAKEYGRKQGSPEQTFAMLNQWEERLNDEDVYAGDIIGIFRDCHFGSNEEENIRMMISAYRFVFVQATIHTEGQRWLAETPIKSQTAETTKNNEPQTTELENPIWDDAGNLHNGCTVGKALAYLDRVGGHGTITINGTFYNPFHLLVAPGNEEILNAKIKSLTSGYYGTIGFEI